MMDPNLSLVAHTNLAIPQRIATSSHGGYLVDGTARDRSMNRMKWRTSIGSLINDVHRTESDLLGEVVGEKW